VMASFGEGLPRGMSILYYCRSRVWRRPFSRVRDAHRPAVADMSPRARVSAFWDTVGRRVIVRYQRRCGVPDILIRDVPDDVVAAIDAKAQRAGLSRTEYLRRTLSRERADDAASVTVADLTRFAETFADLDDPEVMGQAWR